MGLAHNVRKNIGNNLNLRSMHCKGRSKSDTSPNFNHVIFEQGFRGGWDIRLVVLVLFLEVKI